MELYICEKPSLARAVAKGLGSGLNESAMKGAQQGKGCIEVGDKIVTHCFGHMLELLDPDEHDEKYKEWSLDLLPMRFPPKLKVKKEAKKQYSVIASLLKKASSIVNVGDPDEEGQLLVDEIINHEKCAHKPTYRLLIADLNETAVKKSIQSMSDNADHVNGGKVALARSISDQMFGYNLTRCYTLAARQKGYGSVISIGRVQTAIVNMIFERCQAVQNHQESFYYKLIGQFNINGVVFPAAYQPISTDPVNEKNQIEDPSFCEKLANKIENKQAVIEQAEHKTKFKVAPMPYTLATLQSDCARKFGISAQDTLDVAQSLYEKHTLITYPRSNCKYLGDDHFDERTSVLSAITTTSPVFEKVAKGATSNKPHRAFNSKKVGAHHGIIPTTKSADFDKLSALEQKIYNLIARAYIAINYPSAEYATSKVTLKIAELQFHVGSEARVSEGWEILYQNDLDNPDIGKTSECNTPLSMLSDHDKGLCSSSEVQQKKAPKPKFYVESTLLRELTHVAKHIAHPDLKKIMIEKFKLSNLSAELGTEATRASILEKVFESGLAEKVKLKGYKELAFITTDIANQLIPILPNGCKKVDVTAHWVNMGNDITEGRKDVNDYVDNVYQFIEKQVDYIKQTGLSIKVDASPCPKCNAGFLRFINTGKNPFFGCTNHPDCDAVFSEYKGKPFTQKHNCPDCGKPLILRKTKSDYWFGCSGYESGCESSFACTNGKPTKRPKKRQGSKRRSRTA